MKKNSKNKMQRKAQSRRKKWTNAERFANKQKNLIRLSLASGNAERTANRLLAEAQAEIVAETEHTHEEHVHNEDCKH